MDTGTVAITAAIAGPLCGVLAALVAGRRSRRQQDAELAKTEAEVDGLTVAATAAVQRLFGSMLTDMQAQVDAARAEASASRAAAREAEKRAQEAERQAWRAESWAHQMQGLLMELRPALEMLPDARAWLERIDRVIGTRTA